jgi:hypothetical protein
MRLRTSLLATWLLATSACSYAFTIGPHEGSQGGTPTSCTTSRAPAVTDTVVAVASAVVTVAAVYACTHSGPEEDDQSCVRAMLLAPPAATTALVFGLSAHRGFRDTAEGAREHEQERAQEQAERAAP